MHRHARAAVLALFVPVAASAQDAMHWTYTPSVGETPMQTYLTLAYGVPQTDGLQALATCAIGANWIYADVLLGADIGDLTDGSPVTARISGNGLAQDVDATVYRPNAEEGITGLRLAVPLDDPFWQALGGAQPVRYGVPGYQESVLETRGARGPSRAFVGDCRNIGDLRPPRAKR